MPQNIKNPVLLKIVKYKKLFFLMRDHTGFPRNCWSKAVSRVFELGTVFRLWQDEVFGKWSFFWNQLRGLIVIRELEQLESFVCSFESLSVQYCRGCTSFTYKCLLLFSLANIAERRVRPYVCVIVQESLKSLHYY